MAKLSTPLTQPRPRAILFLSMAKPSPKNKSCTFSDLEKFAKGISNYTLWVIGDIDKASQVISTTTGATARITKKSEDGKTVGLQFSLKLIHKKESE